MTTRATTSSTDPTAPTAPTSLDPAGRHILFAGGRTANAFTEDPVTDEELRQVWQMAQWPPTSANTQPLRVLFVRTAEGRARLAVHMNDGNRPKTLAAPVAAVLARDLHFHDHTPTVMPAKPDLQQVLEANETLRDHMGSYSAAMQAGYFILAARAAGLAAGPMAGFDAASLSSDFFPDGRWSADLVVILGHPATDAYHPRLPRLPEQDVLRWS